MNRICLVTTYLLAIATLSFAQQPNPLFADQPVYASQITGDADPSLIPSAGAEFAPLNNLPFFPGGQRVLQAYLNEQKLFPHSSLRNPPDGRVLVGFRVMATGELTEIRLVQSANPQLDQIALRAVANMPRWYPAHREGVAVSSLYILPITFRFDGLMPSSLAHSH